MCGTLRYLIVCLFLAKIIDNRNGMRGIIFRGLLLLSNIVYQSLDIFSVVSFSTKYSFSFSLYEFFFVCVYCTRQREYYQRCPYPFRLPFSL